jgi:N-acetyl-alpha-D-glucosaminyl L-malate synthase BshA
MKIGIVLYPTFGGSGVVATELGKALAGMGHQVHFITYSQPVRLDMMSDNIMYHEVNVPNYPLFQFPPYETALASRMVDVVKRENLDLLHVHYAIPHAFAAYMAKQILAAEGILIPVVTTLHGTDITLVGRNANYRPAVQFSINASDAVTSVSESLRQDTLTHFDIEREIQVIPNFIDFDMYQPHIPCIKDKWAPDGERLVTHISNFRRVKRTADVIRVFAGIREKLPARLIMVGDGPERDNTEQLAYDLGVGEYVKFIGKSSEISPILCITDLFLLPSETESFGLAALEAMACHVPVVSSNTGGLPEVNIHGETGYLANVGDVGKMTDYAVKILSDIDTLNRYKEKAYQQAQRFNLNIVLPKYLSVYQQVTGISTEVSA